MRRRAALRILGVACALLLFARVEVFRSGGAPRRLRDRSRRRAQGCRDRPGPDDGRLSRGSPGHGELPDPREDQGVAAHDARARAKDHDSARRRADPEEALGDGLRGRVRKPAGVRDRRGAEAGSLSAEGGPLAARAVGRHRRARSECRARSDRGEAAGREWSRERTGPTEHRGLTRRRRHERRIWKRDSGGWRRSRRCCEPEPCPRPTVRRAGLGGVPHQPARAPVG